MDKPMLPIEIIRDGAAELAYIVSRDLMPAKTQFLTPDSLGQQMGMIVYAAGTSIPRHVHLPVVREVHGTSEVIVVRKGCCEVDIFNSQKEFVATRRLETGDVILLIQGGHGFRMIEDTVLFEVKQGPYLGLADKARFE
jgi:hypothetical protein